MPEEEEFQEVESSGSTNTLLIALLAAIVGVGVGFGVMFFMNSGSAGEGGGDGDQMRGDTETAGQLPEEVSEKLHRQATFYVSLGSFEVNLKDDFYLSAEVQLKVIDYQHLHQLEQNYTSNQTEQAIYRPGGPIRAVPAVGGGGGGGGGNGDGSSGSSTPEVKKIIEKRKPEMRSLMIDVFNSTPSRELRDPDGKDRIRENIRESLNDMIRDDKGKILEVLFSKFVLAPVS